MNAPQGWEDEVIHTLKLYRQVQYLGEMKQPGEVGVMAELMNGTELDLVELCPVKVSMYRWRPLMVGLK